MGCTLTETCLNLVLPIFLLVKQSLKLQEADLYQYMYYIFQFALLRNVHETAEKLGVGKDKLPLIGIIWPKTPQQKPVSHNIKICLFPLQFTLRVSLFTNTPESIHKGRNSSHQMEHKQTLFQWIKTQVSVNSTEYSLWQMQFL